MGCVPERDGSCNSTELPAHRVQISSFEIGRYEVTQEFWEAVMGENPSHNQSCARCPVENVSWDAIQTFLRKLNELTGDYFRLPTEAEQEYAARGGQQSRSYKYAGGNDLDSVAWYSGNSGGSTHPVGQKQANELGLYDMTGNIDEWVQDCWNDSHAGAPTDGSARETGDCTLRGEGGGSYANGTGFQRIAFREKFSQGIGLDDMGFRVARTPAP